jgi:hypothetical protein
MGRSPPLQPFHDKSLSSEPNSCPLGNLPTPTKFGKSTGRARRTCLLNRGLPERGVWCESTAFRHFSNHEWTPMNTNSNHATDFRSVSIGVHSWFPKESKPQQTGTRLLPGHGEVATTSGSTNFLPGRLIVGQRPLKARMLVRFQPRQPRSVVK